MNPPPTPTPAPPPPPTPARPPLRQAGPRPNLIARAVLAVLRWYRDAVSPALPPRCRFYPTCSAYAVTAVHRYGAARGGWLAVRRIVRCGPWHPGGVDHVPSMSDSDGDHDSGGRSRRLDATPKSVGPQRRPVRQESAVV